MGNCCKKDSVIEYACNRDVFMRNFINWNNVDDSIPMVNAVFKNAPVFCQIRQKRLQPRITGTPCGLRHHHAKPVK